MKTILLVLFSGITAAQTQPPKIQAECENHGGCWDIEITAQGPLRNTLDANVDIRLYPQMRNPDGRLISTGQIHRMWGHKYIFKDAQPDEARIDEFADYERKWMQRRRAGKSTVAVSANVQTPANGIKPTGNNTTLMANSALNTAGLEIKNPLANCKHIEYPERAGIPQAQCWDEKDQIKAILAKLPQTSITSLDTPTNRLMWIIITIAAAWCFGFPCLFNFYLTFKPHRYHTLPQFISLLILEMNTQTEQRYIQRWKKRAKPVEEKPAEEKQVIVGVSPLKGVVVPSKAAPQLKPGPILPRKTIFIEEETPFLRVSTRRPSQFEEPGLFLIINQLRKELARTVGEEFQFHYRQDDSVVLTCLNYHSKPVETVLQQLLNNSHMQISFTGCGKTQEPKGIILRHWRLGNPENLSFEHPATKKPALAPVLKMKEEMFA